MVDPVLVAKAAVTLLSNKKTRKAVFFSLYFGGDAPLISQFANCFATSEIRTLYHQHRNLFDRAIAIEDNAKPNLITVKWLGRDWSWRDFVSGNMDQIAWCGMFHELDMPCGCFDGG